jgi:hypothetical protein
MTTTLDAVRAAALFASDLVPDQHPGPEQVRRAVTAVLHRHGAGWCGAQVAGEFDAEPAAAARRMAWVLRVVRDCYAKTVPVPPTRCRVAVRGRQPGDRPVPPDGDLRRCHYPAGRYRRPAS